MKTFFLLFCLALLLTIKGSAQPSSSHVVPVTIFYDQNWDVTVKQEASFFRVASLDTVQMKFAGMVTDYYGPGIPFRQVNYGENGKEGSLQVFYANKKLQSQGFFLNNHPGGTWKYYYPDGNPKQTIQFLKDQDFKVIEFFNSTGQQLIKNGTGHWESQKVTNVGFADLNLHIRGQWKDSLKVGTWVATQADGRKVYEELFEAGVFKHGQLFDNTGQKIVRGYTDKEIGKSPFHHSLEQAEKLEISNIFGSKGRAMQYVLRKEHLLPIDTSRYAYKNHEVMPEYEGGNRALLKYMAETFRVPSDAAKAAVQGTVVLSLVIGVDGKVTNAKIIKSLHPSIDGEALRVARGLKKWKPGTVNGVPASMAYIIPYRIAIR